MEAQLDNKLYLPPLLILTMVIIVEGFVSISAEILTIRQLIPVAGSSVIVTSLIIGIFLLFLALGYQRGGRPYPNPQGILRRNFFISAAWLGIGLSYTFVELFFFSIQKLTGPHIIYALTFYLLFIIAPLIFILGQTVPITMNMIKQNQTVGRIGGNILFLSTIGSFLGAILTTIILLQYLGVAYAIFINSLCLLLLALLLTESKHSIPEIRIGVALVLASAIFIANVSIEKTFFLSTNSYANYNILTNKNSTLKPDEKILVINNALSSYTNDELKGFPYIELIKRILFTDLKLRGENILVLGAGGFSLSAENTYQNNFTYVDIDKSVKHITTSQLRANLPENFVVDDARHYLLTTKNKYQAIVVDVYSNIQSIPSHLLTREYMQAVKARLTDGGSAIFNVISNPFLTDPYSKRIDNTIRSVFNNCMAIPNSYTNRPTNIIYACQNISSNDTKVYTDNLNTSTTDSFSW